MPVSVWMGWLLTAMFQCLPVRWRPPAEVSSAPETQGSVHRVLTTEQHCRARVVIVGGEGRARNEWAEILERKGLKWKVKGRGKSRDSKGMYLAWKEGMFHFQHLFIFAIFIFN